MPALRHFVNHASTRGLKSYFAASEGFQEVDWSGDHPDVASKVISLFDHQPVDVKVQIKLDLERIRHMSDEIGQAALMSLFDSPSDSSGKEELMKYESASERSLWVFQNHRDRFRKAEDIRYTDQYRHSRKWSGYQVSSSLPICDDDDAMESFKSGIKTLFGLGEKVKVDMFERLQPDAEGKDVRVIQIMVYQEGLPDSYLEFKGDEDIVPRIRRPVSEHAITYSVESGTFEVVAARQERRDLIAKAFTENLLKQSGVAEKLTLRRFNLEPLMNQLSFDCDIEDGIQSVHLVQLKVKNLSGDGRVQFEVPSRSKLTLHDYVAKHFGDHNPLTSGSFTPVQARIAIRFHPENGSRRCRILPVKLSAPNGCDLKSRTERERLIGEKYLKRWGLLSELDEADSDRDIAFENMISR